MTSFPGGWPEAVSTPKIELAWGHNQPSEDRSPCSSPPKKWATEEMAESLPPHEAALPRGMSQKDILPKRYEVFTLDYDWVQSVRGSLLGLEAGTSPSRRDIDNSNCFIPRMAASKTDLPEVITKHWLPILRREGLLMECPPDQFIAPVDWIPLYVVPPQSWGDRSDTKHSKCLLLGGRRLNQLTLIPKPKGSGGARAATAQIGPANKRDDTKRCLPVEASLRPGEAIPW